MGDDFSEEEEEEEEEDAKDKEDDESDALLFLLFFLLPLFDVLSTNNIVISSHDGDFCSSSTNCRKPTAPLPLIISEK
jgi:hypothetical protein